MAGLYQTMPYWNFGRGVNPTSRGGVPHGLQVGKGSSLYRRIKKPMLLWQHRLMENYSHDSMFNLLFRLPFFPNLTHQVGTRIQRFITGLPTGRGDFARVAVVLESLQLADKFIRVASHRRGEHFHSLDDTVRIDDETSANINAALIVIDAVHLPDFTARIGKHRIRHAAVDHFGQLIFLPHLVDEVAVGADRKNFGIQRL